MEIHINNKSPVIQPKVGDIVVFNDARNPILIIDNSFMAGDDYVAVDLVRNDVIGSNDSLSTLISDPVSDYGEYAIYSGKLTLE